jgi:hypothetical protein
MKKGDTVVYKLAPSVPEDADDQSTQETQHSSSLQSSQLGWRFKGSRALITNVGQEEGEETEYTIQMLVRVCILLTISISISI